MDFLSGLAKSAQSKPSSDQPSNADHPEKPASTSDLFASAKVMAEAAQAGDKVKAAGAAADILDAAGDYGKLDETKGVGKYVEQAEGYLRKYGSSGAGDHKAAVAGESTAPADAEKHSGGGDYLKMAQDYLSKPSGNDGEKKESSGDGDEKKGSGGGYGDLMKAAGGFLNK